MANGNIHVTISGDVRVADADVVPISDDVENLRDSVQSICPLPPEGAGPNVLMITVDDAWAGEFSPFGADPGQNEAATPNINRLAAAGVVFERAYSKPLCSPSRGAINTGRYGFHTGLGQLAGESGGAPLSLSETLIPTILCARGYVSACIGKWHLAGVENGGERHPLLAGYHFWRGSLRNFAQPAENHYLWQRTTASLDPDATQGIDVFVQTVARWAAEQTIDDALGWINAQSEPWFCNLNFNSVHTPIQGPPAGTFDAASYPDVVPGTYDGDRTNRFKAMIENVDFEIGRLLSSLPTELLGRTHVIVLADNGTNRVQPPWPETHVKRTCYEPGIHVPLVWAGPGIAGGGRRYPHWIQFEDLFVTIAELAGTDFATDWPGLELDGLSFVPALTDPAAGEIRTVCYTEAFAPNVPHSGAVNGGLRCVQRLHSDGKRYKLMRFVAGLTPDATDEMYNLTDDPVELTNLIPGGTPRNLTPVELAAYNQLWADFIATVNS